MCYVEGVCFFFAGPRSGFSRSVGGRGILNATPALLRAAQRSARRLIGDASPLATALSDTSVVLQAMQDAWGAVDVSSDTGVPFSVVIFAATPLVLRSTRRSFSPLTRVRIGGVECGGTVASADGHWLAVLTPSPVALCGSEATDCSYASLSVTNPSTDAERGVTLSCPPFCSGVLAPWSSVVPLPLESTSGYGVALVPAAAARPGALPVALGALDFGALGTGALSPVYSPGIYFAVACSDSGIYTDPSTGQCTNQSSPGFQLCAFGGGDACKPCPQGGMCPGGFRCWSLPGFFAPLESSPVTIPCSEPGALEKCVGWSVAISQTRCGPGYLQVGGG